MISEINQDVPKSGEYKPSDVVALAFYITIIVILFILCVGGAIIKFRERWNARTLDLHSNSGMVTKAVLRRFPIRFYQVQRDLQIDHNAVSDTCVICFQEYIVDDAIRDLPCHHSFHKNVIYVAKLKCIDPWLTRFSPLCPLCKSGKSCIL